ncbi:MAG: TrkH family potassium uptake protein [Clostridia bacterium]|nr:TrkH family potassium uptake protein [Clostridia bacterium]
MNKRLVIKVLGVLMLIEALAMLPSLGIGLIHKDPGDAKAMLYSMLPLIAAGLPMWLLAKPSENNMRAKEGFVIVALAWLQLSLFGALPFVFSGMIPNYIDALFEAVSGFTTTGATVVTDFANRPHGVMFWRAFTHWIGGMGVLVLTLALLPQMTGRTSHLVRAESPGPSMSKIVPKMGDSAKILYLIYAVLTVMEFIALIIAGMSIYDAAIHALSTAGTGGFSTYGASIGAFNSLAIEIIITVFMVLYGVNFALYYHALIGDWKAITKSEELRWYLGIYLFSVVFITIFISPMYGSVATGLRYSTFEVASLVSTTGFGIVDFNAWPQAAKALVLVLMFLGSCAGSTAGGMKTIRVALLCKIGVREVRRTFQPRKVQVIRFEGKGVEEAQLSQIAVFFFVYLALILVGMLLISLENRFDMQANFSAALTCVSNVGPGFGAIASDFAGYGPFAKLVLSLLMLAGRLEMFPILVLFHPAIWRKG